MFGIILEHVKDCYFHCHSPQSYQKWLSIEQFKLWNKIICLITLWWFFFYILSNKAVGLGCAITVVLAWLLVIILKGVSKVRALFATSPSLTPYYQSTIFKGEECQVDTYISEKWNKIFLLSFSFKTLMFTSKIG